MPRHPKTYDGLVRLGLLLGRKLSRCTRGTRALEKLLAALKEKVVLTEGREDDAHNVGICRRLVCQVLKLGLLGIGHDPVNEIIRNVSQVVPMLVNIARPDLAITELLAHKIHDLVEERVLLGIVRRVRALGEEKPKLLACKDVDVVGVHVDSFVLLGGLTCERSVRPLRSARRLDCKRLEVT